MKKLPHLKVVMEHITTVDAVKFIESCSEGKDSDSCSYLLITSFISSKNKPWCTSTYVVLWPKCQEFYLAHIVSLLACIKLRILLSHEHALLFTMAGPPILSVLHIAVHFYYRFCCCNCDTTAPSSEQEFFVSRWTAASQLLSTSTKKRDSQYVQLFFC